MAYNKARDEFFERVRQEEIKRKIEFAAARGIQIVHDETYRLWRVKVGRPATGGAVQIALCTIEGDAADVAYGLAMVAAGAKLPGPDPLGDALNSGDGTYRP